jgi:hypothetical protein
MFHEICGMTDHAWHQGTVVREQNVAPDMPFVGMPYVARFNRVAPRLDLDQQVGDEAQFDVVYMWSMTAAPARAKPNQLAW